MHEKRPEDSSITVSRVSRLAITGVLSFVELSVKLMAGTVIVASKAIKLLLKKKETDNS